MHNTALDTFQSADLRLDYRTSVLFRLIPRGNTLLDIGSGSGNIVYTRGEDFSQITLVDYSATLVERLQHEFKHNAAVRVCRQDAQALQLDDRFDVISACDILEHLPRPEQCVRGMRDHLTEGGVIFVTVPAFPALYGIRDKTYGHLRRYTKHMLRQLLESEGMEVQQLYYWNLIGVLPYWVSEKILHKPLRGIARSGPMGTAKRLLNRLLYWELTAETLLYLPFGLTLVAICKKRT